MKMSSRPLHLHTLESLCADLVAGLSVSVGEDNETFGIDSDAARGVLAWYGRNKNKWEANVQTSDIEAIVDAADITPPNGDEAEDARVKTVHRRYTLVRITAHQFAGLHHAGTLKAKPEDFKFEFREGVTLFEGYNGCGKTSLLNAIIWTLTGQILRPQRAPEAANKDFEFEIDDAAIHTAPPIVPLPDPALEAFTAKAIPVETWVQLEFKDQSEAEYIVRRNLKRGPKDVLKEEVVGIDELGLDPIGTRVGTTMPGILPYVQVGSSSALGKAVSELTGMAPLVYLSSHAGKAKKKIDGDLSIAKRKEIEDTDEAYERTRADLVQLTRKHKLEFNSDEIPTPSTDSTIEIKLGELAVKLEKLKDDGLNHARQVLGDTFDARDATQRSNFIGSIAPALSAVANFGSLPSMVRLAGLTNLTETEIEDVRAFIGEVRVEASMLVEIAAEPNKAARERLYNRVATWMKDHPGMVHDENNCAVCGQSLKDIVDNITGLMVKDHLYGTAPKGDFAGKTFGPWAKHVVGDFMTRLPASLVSEVRLIPPDEPTVLIKKALIEELFNDDAFVGSLSPLRVHVNRACETALESFPDFNFPEHSELGMGRHEFHELNQLISRIERAFAYPSWRVGAKDAVATLMKDVVGHAATGGRHTEPNSLLGQLHKLQTMVTAIEPVDDATVKQKRMLIDIKRRRGFEQRLKAYAKTSIALKECMAVGDLAETQVAMLQKKLHTSASSWRNKIYLSAFPTTSMELVGSRMSGGGDLQLLVGAPRIAAPAQHVSNASALRASLLAFYLAYWQHMLNERGGLMLLLMDDPQELLDGDNRDRLADAAYDIFQAKAQLVLTTHDTRFALALAKRLQGKTVFLNHQYVHPATARRGTIFLTPSIAKVQQLQDRFNVTPDDALTAQDYLSECRVFIEGRMGDLFDERSYPAAATVNFAPTLSDHLSRLRGLVKGAHNELFKNSFITSFINDAALKDGSATLGLLNKSHHRDKALIRPKEVYDIRQELERLRHGVERAHEQFRSFNRREPLAQPETQSASLTPATVSQFKVPLVSSLKAFVRDASYGGSQEIEVEVISSDWFKEKAFFYVRSNTLGFAGPQGSVAIVAVDATAPGDGQLVIARAGRETYARRLLRPYKSEFVALAAETPDPRKSPPTQLLPEQAVALHPIAGMLFGINGNIPTSKAEAVQVVEVPELAKVRTAYRIWEESAIPLALPGQVALGGAEIPLEELDAHIDEYVALHLSDGSNLFKRVGKRLPTPLQNLRQFEAIGGRGVSDILAIGAEHTGFKSVLNAVSIIGVLYKL